MQGGLCRLGVQYVRNPYKGACRFMGLSPQGKLQLSIVSGGQLEIGARLMEPHAPHVGFLTSVKKLYILFYIILLISNLPQGGWFI